MWFRNLTFIACVAFFLTACSESGNKGLNSTGRGSEIVVVGSKVKWDGPVGDTVRATLTRYMQGLPEPEPEFSLVFIPEKNFSDYLQTHRNILFLDIKAGNENSKVETLQNEWSNPQRVIKIKAGSDTAFFTVFAKHADAVRALFNQSERTRFNIMNALSRNPVAEKLLAEKFGIKMVISKDFYVAKNMSNFVWLRSETNANSLGLMIYANAYKDTTQMDPSEVLNTRDRYSKLYIPGPVDGSFMKIERDFYPPSAVKILYKEMFALETRGLWKIQGDFMGGPFVNYTIVDAPRQRIVVFDGYVYYPNKSKRNYMRQLDAIIWGAEIIKPESKK